MIFSAQLEDVVLVQIHPIQLVKTVMQHEYEDILMDRYKRLVDACILDAIVAVSILMLVQLETEALYRLSVECVHDEDVTEPVGNSDDGPAHAV